MTENDSSTLSALVVDDEPLAREGLALRLQEMAEVKILKQCANGREAMEAIAELEPDVLFLDIQMPGMTGFELISEIQSDVMPMVIFVTAYDSFAVDAFKVHAVDYLLKPIEKVRLQDAVAKCLENEAVRVANEEKQRPARDGGVLVRQVRGCYLQPT